jgi:hypothetical protein
MTLKICALDTNKSSASTISQATRLNAHQLHYKHVRIDDSQRLCGQEALTAAGQSAGNECTTDIDPDMTDAQRMPLRSVPIHTVPHGRL